MMNLKIPQFAYFSNVTFVEIYNRGFIKILTKVKSVFFRGADPGMMASFDSSANYDGYIEIGNRMCRKSSKIIFGQLVLMNEKSDDCF